MSVKTFYDRRMVATLARRGVVPTFRPPQGPDAHAKVAIDAVEECARLRLQVDQLARENQRLHDEIARLRSADERPRAVRRAPADDVQRRFLGAFADDVPEDDGGDPDPV